LTHVVLVTQFFGSLLDDGFGASKRTGDGTSSNSEDSQGCFHKTMLYLLNGASQPDECQSTPGRPSSTRPSCKSEGRRTEARKRSEAGSLMNPMSLGFEIRASFGSRISAFGFVEGRVELGLPRSHQPLSLGDRSGTEGCAGAAFVVPAGNKCRNSQKCLSPCIN